jgi:prepilin-type N-terminal cleavage/methylation domain-containing protein
MKNVSSFPCRAQHGAFTLIELIGVMAIIAIMATVLVPSVLKSVDRAAVTAEQQTLVNLGTQLKAYVRNVGAIPPAPASTPASPTIPAWATQLGLYSELSAADVTYNKRQQARAYLTDTAAPSLRVIVLSSMRLGLGLPAQGNLNATDFDKIWQTPDGTVPVATGFGAWSAANVEYLLIQRIDLHTELQPLRISLNNNDPAASPIGPASYQLFAPGAIIPKAQGQVIKGTPVLINGGALPRDALKLFDQTGNLKFTGILGTADKTFTFDGTTWNPL